MASSDCCSLLPNYTVTDERVLNWFQFIRLSLTPVPARMLCSQGSKVRCNLVQVSSAAFNPRYYLFRDSLSKERRHDAKTCLRFVEKNNINSKENASYRQWFLYFRLNYVIYEPTNQAFYFLLRVERTKWFARLHLQDRPILCSAEDFFETFESCPFKNSPTPSLILLFHSLLVWH